MHCGLSLSCSCFPRWSAPVAVDTCSVGTDGANLNSQAVCILALLGLLALSAPAADARQLKQAAITDADILNFALNLEVRSSTIDEPRL